MTIDLRVTSYILISVALLLVFTFIIIPRFKNWYNNHKILCWAAAGLCVALIAGVLTHNYNSCTDIKNTPVKCIQYSLERFKYDLKHLF